MKQLLKNKNILTLLISGVIVFLLLICSSFFHVLNKSLQNSYYNIKNEIIGLQANPHIIIVEIDDESFQEIGSFPFSRWVYAQILDNIAPYNVAVVAFDVLFLDPSDNEWDTIFREAVERTPNVILGSALSHDGIIQEPVSFLKRGTYEAGFLSPNINSSNRTVYSFSPAVETWDGTLYEHFSVKILRAFYNSLFQNVELSDSWKYSQNLYELSDDIAFPLAQSSSQEVLINFISWDKFTRISLIDLYDSDLLRLVDKEIDLQDTILLIGPAAEGLKDEFFTPNGVEYGVNIHANILNTFLSGKYMMYFQKQLEWVMIFFLIVLSVSVNLSSSSRFLFCSNTAIILVFWFLIPISILLGTNLILNYPSEIIFSLLLAFSSANIVKYLIEDANKQKLNKALSEYVSSNIADEILSEWGKVNLNGEERFLVCFFSDIEGFTTLSERLSPQELVKFLREYLSAMTTVIMQSGWHVDKFEGDAVMALWGAFHKHSKTDYHDVCDSALLQQEALDQLNDAWHKKLGGCVKVRMWIHAGTAIVGNIWAVWKKMDFTALWDNVNTASRLEGVNKHYGTYICVSEIVYNSLKNDFEFRYLDEIQVQGKDIPVKIYELLWRKWENSSDKIQKYQDFESATELYRKQRFTEAQDIFQRLSELWDTPSQVYFKRCEAYLKNPPAEDWNWVWRMMEK